MPTDPQLVSDCDALQELYDATTYLQAVLTFTHTSEDLLSAELDYACRRLIAARADVRRRALIEHRDAGSLPERRLLPPYDQESPAVTRQRSGIDAD